jgi:RNA-binding protein 26
MAGWDPAMMAAMGMGGGSQQQQMEGQGGMTPSNGASATPASNGATLPSAGTGLAPSAGAVGMDGVDQPEGQGVPGMAGPGGFDPQQMAAMQQMMMLQQQGFFPQGGMPFPGGPPPNFQQGGRGGGGFRGRGGGGGFRGRGGSNGGGPSSDGFPRRSNPGPDTDTKPPADRTSTTLVVGSIPPSALALPPINAHFSKFGTVTNIAIDAPSARALVSFATNAEAYAAWKSEDVIFGSRFVKVLWHRPVMGHGQKGKEALDKSKEAMEKLKAGVEGEAVVAPKMSREQVLAKQRVLEGQIAKQKVLMMKVGREGIDKEEKAELMKELRVLAEEMKGGGEESLVRLDKGKAKGTTPAADGNGRGGEEEKKKALDRELEGAGRGMMEGVESAEGPGEEGSSENTEMLKRKLELLKAEVRCLFLLVLSSHRLIFLFSPFLNPVPDPLTGFSPWR